MIWLIVIIVCVAWGITNLARGRVRYVYTETVTSRYWCEVHQDYFELEGEAPYARCPKAWAEFQAMEGQFAE